MYRTTDVTTKSCGFGRVRGGHTGDLDSTNRQLSNLKNKLLRSGSWVEPAIQCTTLTPSTNFLVALHTHCTQTGCFVLLCVRFHCLAGSCPALIWTFKLHSASAVAEKGMRRCRLWTLTCLVVRTDFLQTLLLSLKFLSFVWAHSNLLAS